MIENWNGNTHLEEGDCDSVGNERQRFEATRILLLGFRSSLQRLEYLLKGRPSQQASHQSSLQGRLARQLNSPAKACTLSELQALLISWLTPVTYKSWDYDAASADSSVLCMTSYPTKCFITPVLFFCPSLATCCLILFLTAHDTFFRIWHCDTLPTKMVHNSLFMHVVQLLISLTSIYAHITWETTTHQLPRHKI